MRGAGAPLRPLLTLTAAVLAVHMMLLQGAPAVRAPGEPTTMRKFTTRTIEMGPAAEPPSQTPVAQAQQPPPQPLAQPQPESAARQAAPVLQNDAQAPAPAPAPPAAAAVPAQSAESGPVASAFKIPRAVRHNYEVFGQRQNQSLSASAFLFWRHNGEAYEATFEVSAMLLGSRTQVSSGRLTAQGLEPERFAEKGRGEQATHFERDAGVIIFSSNKPTAPLVAGAQDRLSVILQLSAMIAGEPEKYPAGAVIAIPTAGVNDSETWSFVVETEEQLKLPGGEVVALKLTRKPRKEFDQLVELWLSPPMDYAPVRLRLTQPNGDFVDQQWRSTDKP